jgi:hypothetical protein
MNRKGVCYDVGRVIAGENQRPDFDERIVARELEIIREDLHCTAVRICGQDVDRVVAAAEMALSAGLEAWLSPELWDREPGSFGYFCRWHLVKAQGPGVNYRMIGM